MAGFHGMIGEMTPDLDLTTYFLGMDLDSKSPVRFFVAFFIIFQFSCNFRIL